MSNIKITKNCEVCGNTNLESVLNLGKHPMCDDLIKVDDERQCEEYPIEILFCDKCQTAHQAHQIPKKTLFPKDYHYRAKLTEDVQKGMEELVASIMSRYGSVENKKVLDIGCNDGSLLNKFKAQGANTFGIEPTDAALDAKEQDHVVFQDYFTEELASHVCQNIGHPDFITFTNVFAHIEDLHAVIRALKAVMGPKTSLVIENHYLGDVIDKMQFDTFYHEHPRTYSLNSFKFITRSLGMVIDQATFPSRYGGNIRVYITPEDMALGDHELVAKFPEDAFLADIKKFDAKIKKWIDHKNAEINEIIQATGQPLVAKAFPGRAAILVKLLGLDVDRVSKTYEKIGSMKIGHYLPGTRIPICSDEELIRDIKNTKTILNLAWHIPNEIEGYLNSHGFEGKIIDVIDADSFR